ncbi:MAG TPA: MarC family protein [Candidatus Sulfotelmatobacter sp.]|nr:MarC family protein [Candidatus Sulfotelmatobacter sp.]
MADAIKVLFLILSAIFPIVDPVSGSPIFLALTREYSRETRRELAMRVAIYSFVLMLGSYFVGSHILGFFGVSLPVVQVGGGLIVVAVGWSMLIQNDQADSAARKTIQPQEVFRRAFYPLTLPLTVGPGSISVAITLGANATHRYGVHVLMIVAAVLGTALIGVSIFLCYGFADRLAQVLGDTAMTVIVRLSSFLLVCIGVQIMWDGINALLTSVIFHTQGGIP